MLKVRLIPTLLLKDGRMVKSKQFTNYRDVGEAISAAKIYDAQNADELIFLDISATLHGRSILVDLLNKVSSVCFMPLTVGGGIHSLEEARKLLANGADKVVINSALYTSPELVRNIAESFGNQAMVASIDVRRTLDGEFQLWSHCGTVKQEVSLAEHIDRVVAYGAGEIFVNSIDNDGMMQGFDLELLRRVLKMVEIPVIISGGAGNFGHLLEAIEAGGVALAMASIFHFGDNNPIRTRTFLKTRGVAVKEI
jgi:cyclase